MGTTIKKGMCKNEPDNILTDLAYMVFDVYKAACYWFLL